MFFKYKVFKNVFKRRTQCKMEDISKRKSNTIDADGPSVAKKQSDIAVFFGARPKDNKVKKNYEPKKQSVRTLQAATAENWKSTSLAKYNADDWLVINVDKQTKLVTSLNCLVCTKHVEHITGVKGFQQQWCKEGSKRLQHNAALEHAEGMSHKRAYMIYF